MATDRENIEALRQRCEAARDAYASASRAIEARLQVYRCPTTEEWDIEEAARHALVAARRALADAVIDASASSARATPAPNGSSPTPEQGASGH